MRSGTVAASPCWRTRTVKVVTLSCLNMVYKGLVQANHLAAYYPDLRDARVAAQSIIKYLEMQQPR